jgi:hypothetical protein
MSTTTQENGTNVFVLVKPDDDFPSILALQSVHATFESAFAALVEKYEGAPQGKGLWDAEYIRAHLEDKGDGVWAFVVYEIRMHTMPAA